MKRREQKRMTCVRGAVETKRLSRLNQLTPLVTSYDSFSQEQKAVVAAFLQNTTENLPVDRCRVDEMTLEPEEDKSNAQPDHLPGHTESPGAPLQSVTQDEPVGSAPDEVASDLGPLTVSTEPADFEPPPTQTGADQAEGSLAHSPSRVSSTLAALYSSFLASVRQMGVLLSSRTVFPRPEEQDDETKVTQELSQAQRRLVTEEELIWKRLSEVTSEEETEGGVSFLARELEDKSAKILTSYERRNNPPTSEVYRQSQVILRAMGVPCINANGGVEGEALAAAIVQDGLADYVASEDTVNSFLSFDRAFS